MQRIICFLLLSSCLSGREDVYTKYVYQLPKKIFPYESISNVDTWTSRLRFRGLVKLNAAGMVENDLAKFVKVDKENLELTIYLSENFFSNGNEIDSKAISKSLINSKRNNKMLDQLMGDISPQESNVVKVKLRKWNPHILKVLASPIAFIHDPDDVDNESGYYDYGEKAFLRNGSADSSFPAKVEFQKVDKVSAKPRGRFDTALLSNGSVLFKENVRYFKIFETWGLVLNHQSLPTIVKRKCLSHLLERNKFVEVLTGVHKPISKLNGELESNSECSLDEQITFDIPEELGEEASRICDYFKSMTPAKCNITSFTSLLARIKQNQHQASLLNLTLDHPYLQFLNTLFDPTSNFSLVKNTVDIPKELETLEGEKYINALSRFNERNLFFLPLSRPMRELATHSTDDYTVSIIESGYDPLENLQL